MNMGMQPHSIEKVDTTTLTSPIAWQHLGCFNDQTCLVWLWTTENTQHRRVADIAEVKLWGQENTNQLQESPPAGFYILLASFLPQ